MDETNTIQEAAPVAADVKPAEEKVAATKSTTKKTTTSKSTTSKKSTAAKTPGEVKKTYPKALVKPDSNAQKGPENTVAPVQNAEPVPEAKQEPAEKVEFNGSVVELDAATAAFLKEAQAKKPKGPKVKTKGIKENPGLDHEKAMCRQFRCYAIVKYFKLSNTFLPGDYYKNLDEAEMYFQMAMEKKYEEDTIYLIDGQKTLKEY